jgi:SNF2 family DNA or RNA helicase
MGATAEGEQAGFGVMLPAWWTRRGARARLSARAKVKSPGLRSAGRLSLDEILHFDWEVALGGQALSMTELQELARLKSPLVQLRGQWVEVNAEEIRTAVALWQKRQASEATAREIVQMALGQGAAGSLPLAGVTATGWVGDLLAGLEGAAELEQVSPPVGFQCRLQPYQERGYSWLCFLRRWGLGACLADDMGLGKTIQALALIQREWEGDERRPTLLVCPTSVVRNWEKEAQRFTPQLPVMIHHGAARTRGDQFRKRAERQAMVISSYALLHRDYETLKSIGWAAVILDEAQNAGVEAS